MELRHLPEYKELQELKRLRKQKIHELQSESAFTQHVGYKVQPARAHTYAREISTNKNARGKNRLSIFKIFR